MTTKISLVKTDDGYVCKVDDVVGFGPTPELAVEAANVEIDKKRPWYFLVTVWERQFCDYFINYCIPSLLSPGNIPALKGRQRVIIACPENDFLYIKDSRPGKRLGLYCDIEWLPFERPESIKINVHRHMGKAHLGLTKRAFDDMAFGVLLTPDMMLADGSLAFCDQKRKEGYKVVLTLALRSEEEALFQKMDEFRVDVDRGFSKRQMAWCATRSLHSQSMQYEWQAGYFSPTPSAIWWRMPEEQMLIYGLSWNPIFVDYSHLNKHDDNVMREWTIDGDYIYKNFGDDERLIYVCQDSDEVIQVSWSPKLDRPASYGKHSTYKAGDYEEFEEKKRHWLHNWFYSKSFEPLKRRIFFQPVRWHSEDLTEDWTYMESVCTKYLKDALAYE